MWLYKSRTETPPKTDEEGDSIAGQGGGNSNIVYFHPYLEEWSHFDEHIFQMGWNHQLVIQ